MLAMLNYGFHGEDIISVLSIVVLIKHIRGVKTFVDLVYF